MDQHMGWSRGLLILLRSIVRVGSLHKGSEEFWIGSLGPTSLIPLFRPLGIMPPIRTTISTIPERDPLNKNKTNN